MAVQSVLNALRVFEEVATRQPAGVGEVARALGMPKSSVHRAIVTLCDGGWMRSTGGERPRYVVTSRALSVGRNASPELGLRETALPEMVRLRDATNETIHLCLWDGHNIVLVERVDSTQAVRTYHPLGIYAPLTASSSGKAVLALLAPAEIDRIIATGLHKYTDHTIVDEAILRADLASTRRRGYARNDGEWRVDVAAVAAAIRGDDGLPIGVVNISAPASRATEADLQRAGKLLVQARSTIEEHLGLRRPPGPAADHTHADPR